MCLDRFIGGIEMRAEATLQWMADFYSDIIPTRLHALDHLFCTIGNGFTWVNGELVDDSELSSRYKMVEEVEKAEFPFEFTYMPYIMKEKEKRAFIEEKRRVIRREQNPEKRKALFDEISSYENENKLHFSWYPLSYEYSYLFNYPKDIKADWLALIEECKAALDEDGIDWRSLDGTEYC